MATIDIKASTVTIEEKRAAELCGVLAEMGIEFTFTPTINPNEKRGHLFLHTLCWSVRANRVLKEACEMHNLNYDKTCISEFCHAVSRNNLLKVRNCGKRALEEIEHMLYENGFSLA